MTEARPASGAAAATSGGDGSAVDPSAGVTFPIGPGRTLTLWLYRGLANAGDVHAALMAGALRPEGLALLDTTLVPHLLPVLAAASKASRGARPARLGAPIWGQYARFCRAIDV